MDKEVNAVCLLDECLAVTKRSLLEVLVDVVARNPFRPVTALLHIRLYVHSLMVASNDPVTDAEAAIRHDYLPRAIERLHHLQHGLRHLLKAIVLRWECPRPICLLWLILPLDELHPKQNRLPLIPVGNYVLFISEWVRLAWHAHEPRTELTKTRVHGLIEAAHPQRDVVPILLIVEGVQHLADFMEPIHEASRCFFVSETDGRSNVRKAVPCHGFGEPEGGTLKHADGLTRPPVILIADPLETCHEEVASKPLVELLHHQARVQMNVGGSGFAVGSSSLPPPQFF
jgi:hypothetical protein